MVLRMFKATAHLHTVVVAKGRTQVMCCNCLTLLSCHQGSVLWPYWSTGLQVLV